MGSGVPSIRDREARPALQFRVFPVVGLRPRCQWTNLLTGLLGGHLSLLR